MDAITMSDPSQEGVREKKAAALSSVIAAVGLTVFKLIVGFVTGSLGILAEAAHSGLDLLAALVTLFAVRASAKPADSDHLYGHGKVENLSALFETLLLLVTCVWIIYEAIQRLFVKSVEVEASVWAFLVMVVSIVVDVNRSRMLYRAARKFNSQALEADALHFRTDIWSSSVVILGLVGVRLAQAFPRLDLLRQADSVAALGVAMIVVVVSLQLGKRTILALLDTAPPGLTEDIKARIEAIPGIAGCHRIRVRTSGAHMFVDVHVTLDGDQSLERAHALTERVEDILHQAIPVVDITVHPEPAPEASVP